MMIELPEGLVIPAILFVLVSPFLLYIGVRLLFSRRRQQREAAERAEANRRDAEAFFSQLTAEGASAVQCRLILGADEHALLVDDATLYETRAQRIYVGAGTSVKGIRVGGGASESQQVLRQVDAGTLVLTTRRLVFDGTSDNRTLKLSDILSAEPMLDAIEVSTQRRAKSMIFAVPNPLIWAPMIGHAASGRINIDRQQ